MFSVKNVHGNTLCLSTYLYLFKTAGLQKGKWTLILRVENNLRKFVLIVYLVVSGRWFGLFKLFANLDEGSFLAK
jgi:hypothetical protein